MHVSFLKCRNCSHKRTLLPLPLTSRVSKLIMTGHALTAGYIHLWPSLWKACQAYSNLARVVRLPQVEKLLARLSDRVSELTEITAQGDTSALCAQLLVRRLPQPPSWPDILPARNHASLASLDEPCWLASQHIALQRMPYAGIWTGCLAEEWRPGMLPACMWSSWVLCMAGESFPLYIFCILAGA